MLYFVINKILVKTLIKNISINKSKTNNYYEYNYIDLLDDSNRIFLCTD